MIGGYRGNGLHFSIAATIVLTSAIVLDELATMLF